MGRRGLTHQPPPGDQKTDQLLTKLGKLLPATLERRTMLKVWIHRAKILKQELDRIDLLLPTGGGGCLKRRESHQRFESQQVLNLKAPPFLASPAETLPWDMQS